MKPRSDGKDTIAWDEVFAACRDRLQGRNGDGELHHGSAPARLGAVGPAPVVPSREEVMGFGLPFLRGKASGYGLISTWSDSRSSAERFCAKKLRKNEELEHL